MENGTPLVTTSWLQDHLHDDGLRLFDATVFLRFPDGVGAPYVIESGRAAWEDAHIPGAQFIDLVEEISDLEAPTNFTMLAPEEFCERMARFGVDDSSTVVVYSTGSVMWASRLWWMLRSVGFDRCRVLDGGFAKWLSEGRPTSTERPKVAPAVGKLTARPRPEMWATKQEVMDSIGKAGTRTINALPPDAYSGVNNNYGRAGHIPGSLNMFYGTLIDEETGTFLPPEQLRDAVSPFGALGADRVICYCGGGISATIDALALHLLGHKNVAVYDGSMSEWVRDEAAPLKVGNEP